MCVYHLFLSTDCILLQYVLQFQLLSIFFSLLYTRTDRVSSFLYVRSPSFSELYSTP